MDRPFPTPLKPIDTATRLAAMEEDIGLERDVSRRMNVAVYFTAGDCLRTIRDEQLLKRAAIGRLVATFASGGA